LWFHCRKCGKFLPRAALAGLGSGVALLLSFILAINIFFLHAGTAEWLNDVCVPTLIVTIPFFLLYVIMARGDLSLCKECNLRKTAQVRKATLARDNARKTAILSRKSRQEQILRADPDMAAILEEMKSGKRVGWQPDERTLILLRLARNLERQFRYAEAADILQRLGLDTRASLMMEQASKRRMERTFGPRVD
jgi:hypothetical protein